MHDREDEAHDREDEAHDREDEAVEAQQWLVETALGLVFATHDEALAHRVADPLVVLVDCEDPLGGQIARSWLGAETVQDAIAAQQAGEDDQPQTTVFARAVAWDDAAELAELFPYLAATLRCGPPKDGVLVVGVTAGGASALTAPWDARP